MKFRLIGLLLAVCLLSCSVPVRAIPPVAADITADTAITLSGFPGQGFLTDGDLLEGETTSGGQITIENAQGMGYLYFIFRRLAGPYTLEDPASGQQVTLGQHGILHDCIDLAEHFGSAPTAVTVRFGQETVTLNELTVYAPGVLPSHVQRWQPPAEGKTDILLLSSHADDEQLFYAGLLPLYAGEKGAAVQVVYLTDHYNMESERVHEALNGLWAVGCDVYPILPHMPDFRIDDLEKTYEEYESRGISRDQLLGYVTEQLRRFRPQVVVGHDIAGEYGHGMHRVYTDCLMKALDISGDEAAFPESAEAYGTWQVPKTYLHLYEENPVVIDYDSPLSRFNGMTAFEVTGQLGYPCHKTQQKTWFTRWIYGEDVLITKASQIETFNPCRFGLYRTTVGADVEKNDFLEHITTYAQQERLEQERLEQERLEQERLEQERLEQERLEQERLEQERLEQEQTEPEQTEQTNKTASIPIPLPVLLIIMGAAMAGLILLVLLHRRKTR